MLYHQIKFLIRQKAIEAKRKRSQANTLLRKAVPSIIFYLLDFIIIILDRYEIEGALKRMGIVLPKRDV